MPQSPEVAALCLLGKNLNGEAANFDEALATVTLRQSSVASKHSDGIWRRGSGISDCAEDRKRISDIPYREHLLSYVPDCFKGRVPLSEEHQAAIEVWNQLVPDFHWHARDSTAVNWEKWAIRAGFDRWEHIVLLYILNGTSRERALEGQLNLDNRRALQAAWKRFARNGRERLKKSANLFHKNVPEG